MLFYEGSVFGGTGCYYFSLFADEMTGHLNCEETYSAGTAVDEYSGAGGEMDFGFFNEDLVGC